MYIANQFSWGETDSLALFSAFFCQLLSVGKKKTKTQPKNNFTLFLLALALQPIPESQIQLSSSNGIFFPFADHSWAEAELITSETAFSGWLQPKNAISWRNAEVSETRFCCNVGWSWDILNTIKRQQVPLLSHTPRRIPQLEQHNDPCCQKYLFRWLLSRFLLIFKVWMSRN